ncbi:hypothetical protein [Luteimonas sp. A478]
MNFDILIPISLFAAVAYAIKVTVEAYTRRRIIETRGSEELVRAMLEGEALRRRQSSLQWGSVLVALAVGFGLVEWMGVRDVTPGVVAILLGATGIGNLAYYLIEGRMKQPGHTAQAERGPQ